MTATLQEVDSGDLTTILFDYSDPTGANNPGGVQTSFGLMGQFALNAPGVAIDTSDRLGDGAQDVTFSYDDIVQTEFRMRAKADTYDNLRDGIGTLQRLLGSEGVIKWVPDNANTYYIYRKPSSIPALFAGSDLELLTRLSQFDTPEGLQIVINRERLLRGPTLLASVNKLTNATMLLSKLSPSTAMQGWDWASTSNITTVGYGANVNETNQAYRFTIATTATRNLRQDTAVGTAAPGDIWTFSFYAKATGGSLCKAQAVIEYLDSAFAAIGGGTVFTGTLTTLSATEQRMSVTTTAAPANTSVVRVSLRWSNGDATTYTVNARRAQLEKASAVSDFRVGSENVDNNLSNPLGKSMLVYNPGDANALARLTLSPSSGAKAIAFVLARKSEGLDTDLTEAINNMGASVTSYRTKAKVINATMYAGNSGDTSSVADSDATDGGPAAKTTFTNQSSLVRRWRWVSTPSAAAALRGTWSVYAAVRGETGNLFRVCMHWQAANRDPVTNAEDVITYDTTDANSSVYTPLYLGEVDFDANAGDASLTIEGWAARDIGSGALWWDVVYLVPSDEQQVLLQVPGFRAGEQAAERWLGSELTTQVAGSISDAVLSGTQVNLNTQNGGVGSPPSSTTTGGLVWAAGRHMITVNVDLENPDGVVRYLGYLRIRKAPGPGNNVTTFQNSHAYSVGDFVKPSGGNLAGRTFRVTTAGTSAGSEPGWNNSDGATTTSNTAVFTETTVASRSLLPQSTYTMTKINKTVSYTTDGTTAFEAVVIGGSGLDDSSNPRIHVLTMKHSTQRVVDDGYAAQLFGDTKTAQTANGAVSIDDLVKQGPFITLGPGLNALWLDLWSLPPTNYDDIDFRDELAKHDPTVSTTVSVDVIPRYWT